MRTALVIIFLAGCSYILPAQKTINSEPLTATYSIVAIDKETGEMGVAVQSHWYSVGTIVSWGEAGVGVIATQSLVNPSFGPDGLDLLKMGFSAKEVVEILTERDEGREFRQLAVLDANGNASGFTGKDCIEAAGHIEGEGYSVQANLMRNTKVWPAMDKAFKQSKGQPLAERLLKVLFAAENAGGDIRGQQSAALLVVGRENTNQPWVDRKVDLRVDDHAEPLKELERLLKVHTAYEHMNKGDLAIEKSDFELAMVEYGAAEALFPENEEMQYWHAIALANIGKLAEALPIFERVFKKNGEWAVLTPRLTKNGILTVDDEALNNILDLAKK